MGQVVQAGAGNDGGGQEKREAGRGFPGEAQEEGAGHGDAAAGDPGHDGQGLGEADEHRVKDGEAVKGPVVTGYLLPHQQENPHGTQEQGNVQGLPENGFRFFLQEQARQAAGDGGHHQVEKEVAFSPVLGGGPHQGVAHGQPLAPEISHQGSQGTQMEEDIKTQTGSGHLEVVFQEGQMAGAGDGQELSNALDQTQENGSNRVHR